MRPMNFGPKGCDCAFCADKPADKKGQQPCEYYDHHCEVCHERGYCTARMCQAELSAKREQKSKEANAEGDAAKLGELAVKKRVGDSSDNDNDRR